MYIYSKQNFPLQINANDYKIQKQTLHIRKISYLCGDFHLIESYMAHMNRSENNIRSSSQFHQALLFTVLNLLMLVMVGKGMVHLSHGASAGYLELLLGTLGLICTPFVQAKTQNINPSWTMPMYWIFLMGFFGVYAFLGMVNPFI